MKSLAKVALISLLALGACSKAPETAAENPAPAPAPVTAKLEISLPWAAVTPTGAKVGAGYLTIANPGEADKLLGAASPRAKKVEVHEMKMEGAMMSMRPVESLDVPAGATITLAPGGYHLMFIDIDAPFVEGQTIPVTLTFEKAGAVDVVLSVSKAAPVAAAAGDASGMKMEGH
jgi:periplasmic copper chaperone A